LESYKTSNRRILKTKMASALNSDISALPSEMKSILIDDLVTAFENRKKALAASQSNISFTAHTEEIGLKATV
jgi:hypothetical protein